MKIGKGNMRLAWDQMINFQLIARGICDDRVLEAMKSVPRHLFVEAAERDFAYEDHPIPIGHGQTISQPYIVAFMTEALAVKRDHTVLEIGTGSGYQTAILSKLAKKVISLEVIPALAKKAEKRLQKLGFINTEVHCADGYGGWPAEAPYQRIIGTAAPKRLPKSLVEQLTHGGCMVLPAGRLFTGQYLRIISKDNNGQLKVDRSLPVRFVPMVRV